MLPFDNKSEFQIVVDMPAGTPVEKTAAVLHELGRIYKQYRKSPIIKPMRVRLHRLILMGWCANTIYVQPVSLVIFRLTSPINIIVLKKVMSSQPASDRHCRKLASVIPRM
jgi:hypothetical protein